MTPLQKWHSLTLVKHPAPIICTSNFFLYHRFYLFITSSFYSLSPNYQSTGTIIPKHGTRLFRIEYKNIHISDFSTTDILKILITMLSDTLFILSHVQHGHDVKYFQIRFEKSLENFKQDFLQYTMCSI